MPNGLSPSRGPLAYPEAKQKLRPDLEDGKRGLLRGVCGRSGNVSFDAWVARKRTGRNPPRAGPHDCSRGEVRNEALRPLYLSGCRLPPSYNGGDRVWPGEPTARLAERGAIDRGIILAGLHWLEPLGE